MSRGYWTASRSRQANAEADERSALRERALRAEAEVERLRQQVDGQTAAFNARHDEIEQARSEVERLRALCAARPRPMRDSKDGRFTDAALNWFDKIDAAGRGEG